MHSMSSALPLRSRKDTQEKYPKEAGTGNELRRAVGLQMLMEPHLYGRKTGGLKKMCSCSWRECVKRKKKRTPNPEFQAWECLGFRSSKKKREKKRKGTN